VKNQRQILASLILAAGACAYGQSTDASQASEDTQSQEQPSAPPTPRPILDVALSNRTTSGNFHNYMRYGTPPNGPYLRGLSFDSWTADMRTIGGLWLRDVGEPDYYSSGRMEFNYGRTQLSLSNRRTQFYDPTP